jgi:hypothetical protein
MELFTICDTKFHVFESNRETYLQVFDTYILVGVFLFGAMAAAATVLWYATDVMREHRVPAFICWICELVSELLFFLDVICLLFLMGVEVWKLLRDVWGTLRETGEVNERSQGSS